MARERKGRKCKANKVNGDPCPNWAMKGGMVCHAHGGKAPQVKARADVRYELENWGLTDELVNPDETLLKLVSQSARRVDRYSAEIEAEVEKHDGSLQQALLENTMFGEQIRKMVKLEAEERDRCANFATKAIKAGIAERQVRLAERQEDLAVAMLRAALAELNLPPQRAQEVMAKALAKAQALVTTSRQSLT